MFPITFIIIVIIKNIIFFKKKFWIFNLKYISFIKEILPQKKNIFHFSNKKLNEKKLF